MKYQSDFIFLFRLSVSIALITLLCSCMSMKSRGVGSLLFPTESIAQKHTPSLPDRLRMDVGIEEFEENYKTGDAKEYKVFAEVRKAEAKYFPVRLKRSVEKTGFWKGVWVVPKSAIADVKVRGKIIKSTGEELELQIIAGDSTGKKLLDKLYSEKATEYDYTGGRKPFENTFIKIAEDLQKSFSKVNREQIEKVKNNTDLRFATMIAPDAFTHHIDKDDGYKIVSLPADNDPTYQQAIRLREYDALFFDKLQDYYDEFYGEVEQSYTNWANESYLEIVAKKKEQQTAITKGILSGVVTALGVAVLAAGAREGNSSTVTAGTVVTAAGGVGIHSAVKKYKRSKIHDEALRELGASLESSLKPHTMEVEGKTIQLGGSVSEQYLQWHTVLQAQYYAQTQPQQ